MRLAAILLSIAGALVAGAGLLVYALQASLLFPVSAANASAPSRLPADAERLRLELNGGIVLAGLRLPGRKDAPVLLGFGGNAWNADGMALYLRERFPDREIVTFHYRGYAPSEGRPDSAAILADAAAIYDRLQAAEPRAVTAIGFSLGSSVAAELAAERPVRGLVMVTPFDSLTALAAEHFPWLPGSLLRHRLSTVDSLRRTERPTGLIVAARDTIIPSRRSDAVRPAIRRPVYDRPIDAGHNDLYAMEAFHRALIEAVASVEAASLR